MKLLSNYKGLFVLVTFIFMFILTDSVTALAATVELPKTGQTKCYDSSGIEVASCAGTGQDGDIQAGESWPPLRFTVSDLKFRDRVGYDCIIDKLTGLMWVRLPDSIPRTWQEALDYANNLSLCGYTDWRLPNINELESLVNAGQPNTATWLNSHGFSNVQPSIYWSSTSYAGTSYGGPYSALNVIMGEGSVNVSGKPVNYLYVLPVRSKQPGIAKLWKTGQTTCYDNSGNVVACAGTGQDGDIQAGESWPSPRFIVGTGTESDCVTDNLTGLMWTKDANLTGTSMTWQQALNYANSLSLCGYTDWRLPNRKEMHSLTDFSQYTPALPSGHPFLNVQTPEYWSSTPYPFPGYPAAVWVVDMWDGTIRFTGNYAAVWPVRSGQIGGPNPDTDGDGLLDTWEEFGYDWPGNGTGTIDVDLPGMGAKKDHKDIFIEVDYMVKTTTGGGYEDGTSDPNACTDRSDNGPMYDGFIDSADPDCLPHSHQPMTTALQTVIDAFNNAPVDNPDKTTGIHIHIDAGSSSVMNPASGATWGARSRSTALPHSDILGSILPGGLPINYDWTAFQNLKVANFDPARLAIFHYAIFAHDHPEISVLGQSRMSSLDFSIGSSDFIVTLGSTAGGVGNSNDQAIILMHELGHNLGLRHGGGDHINRKPNYLSVMNYSFLDGLIKNKIAGYVDYSQFTPPNLYESNLNETIGLNGGTAMDNYGTIWWCPSMPGSKDTKAVNSAIDWNCDGDGGIDVSTSANINGDYDINTNNAIFSALISQNDWDNIIYAGGAIGAAFAVFSDDPIITPLTEDEPFPVELEEDCDGIDNDGDGQIDEGFPAGNTPCGVDVQVVPNGVTTTFPSVSWSGDTTVTTSNTGPAPPSGFKLGSSTTYYEITSTAAFTGPVEVCIGYNETQFTSERSLKLFHWEGAGWNDITTSLNTTANIICGLTTSFSPFIVAEELSTAVTLQNISAHLDGNQVILTWSTSFEVDNEGFVILRSESPSGPFTPVTQGMIPAVGGAGKATYTFTDANIEHGKTYYYRLQDIDTRGVVTAHNVVPVTIAVAGGNGATGSMEEKDEIFSLSSMQAVPSGTSSPRNDSENNNSGMDDIGGGTDGSQGLSEASQQQDRPTIWIPGVMTDTEGKTTTGGAGSAAMADSIDEIKGLSAQQEGQGQVDVKSPGSPPAQLEGSPQAMIHEESSTPLSESTRSIMDSSFTGTGEGYGPSSFSVTIEDRMGNLIKIKRMEGASPSDSTATADSESTTLRVSEESGHLVVTWQATGSGKGFVLYRTEKGKENYKPISGTIPYFGRDGKEQYLYRFIDNTAKSGARYDYRLKVVSSDIPERTAQP